MIRLRRERSFISRLIVMAVFLGVITSMWALNREITQGPQRYLKTLHVDYWVVQKGAGSLSTSSYVDPGLLKELQVSGYQADGMLVYFGKINSRDGIYQSYEPGGVLDPQLKSGRQVQTAHEIVLDQVLASDLHIGLDSQVALVGRRFNVVGLSRSTNSAGKQTAFINQAAMAKIVGQPTYQVLAVRLKADQSWLPSGLSLAGVDVLTNKQFLQTNLQYQENSYSGFFGIIILVSFLGLAIVMVLSLKQAIDSQRAGLARMRAIGASKAFLMAVDAVSTVIVVIPATAIGAALAVGLTSLFNSSVPGISAGIRPIDVVLAAETALLVSLLAEVVPFWKLNRLTPVEGMRG